MRVDRRPSPAPHVSALRRRPSRSTIARSCRSGIRAAAANPAACHRRNSRADTTGRPRPRFQCHAQRRRRSSRQSRADRRHRRAASANGANAAIAASRNQPEPDCSRPGPARRRDSCRRSSRRCPSAAGRARPRVRLRVERARAMLVERDALAVRRAGWKNASSWPSFSESPARQERQHPRRARRRRRSRRCSARRHTAARCDRRSSACECPGRPAAATSAGRRLRQTGGRPRAADVRARDRAATHSAITSCNWSRKPYAPLAW